MGPSGGTDSFLSSAKHLMGDTGPSDTSPLKKEKAEKSQAASKHTEIKEKRKDKVKVILCVAILESLMLYYMRSGPDGDVGRMLVAGVM